MTIESAGYGGDIDTVQWAQLQPLLAARYGVQDSASCQVEPYTTGTYQVQVSTGFAGGWGVVDQITATELYTLPNPASGTQYFLVGLLRDWSAKTTTVSHILAGTSLPSSMPARPQDPGNTQDFQPLALVSLANGATEPQVVYDLRAAGGPNTFNMSADLATLPNWLAYMAFEGNTIWTGHKRWHRAINAATGNPFWDVSPEIVQSGPNLGNSLGVGLGSDVTGWTTVSTFVSTGSRSENSMSMVLQANRQGGGSAISFGASGGVVGGDKNVIQVSNSTWHPDDSVTDVDIRYVDANGASWHAAGRYTPDGRLVLESGAANTQMGLTAAGAEYPTFRATVHWTRQS